MSINKYQVQAYKLGVSESWGGGLQKYLENAVEQIRENTKVLPMRKLSRKYVRQPGVVYDGSLDTYYVAFINDTLDEIRKGKKAYVFKLEHIREIFRFEHNADVKYLADSDTFEISLGG